MSLFRKNDAKANSHKSSQPSAWLAVIAVGALILFGSAPATEAATGRISIEVLPTVHITAGDSASFPFVVRTSVSGGSLSFETLGLPSGATAEVMSMDGGRYRLDVRTASNAPSSMATIALRARWRTRSAMTIVYLRVDERSTVPPTTSPSTTVSPLPPGLAFGLRADNPRPQW